MANHVYPELVRAMARGELGDLESLTWHVQVYDADTVYDRTHAVRDDLAGLVLTSAAEVLPSVSVVVGAAGGNEVDLVCDDTALELPGLSTLDDVEAMVVYIDTGDPATDTLAAYYDRRADTSPVTFTGNGLGVAFTFPLGFFIRL